MIIKKTEVNDQFSEQQTTPDAGTTFYHATLEDVTETLRKQDANIILRHLLDDRGFNALDFDNHFFGGGVYDDELYICITDGQDIDVDGDLIFPEDALEEFGPEALSAYIEEATPEVIHRNVTTYELKPFDIDEVAKNMINSGVYDFLDVVKAAQDADII